MRYKRRNLTEVDGFGYVTLKKVVEALGLTMAEVSNALDVWT